MGKMHFLEQFDFILSPESHTGGGPFPYAVEGQDGGFCEGRGEKGTGGMGFMVFGEDVAAFEFMVECLVHFAGQVQFLFEPEGHTHEELLESAGRKGDERFQHSLKFQQGFIVKYHMVQVTGVDVGIIETVIHSVEWEPMIVFFTGKSFLLGGGEDFAVPQQGGGTIVIEGRDTKDVSFRMVSARFFMFRFHRNLFIRNPFGIQG